MDQHRLPLPTGRTQTRGGSRAALFPLLLAFNEDYPVQGGAFCPGSSSRCLPAPPVCSTAPAHLPRGCHGNGKRASLRCCQIHVFQLGARPGGDGSSAGVALGEALEGDPAPARDGLRSLDQAWQAQPWKGFSIRNKPLQALGSRVGSTGWSHPSQERRGSFPEQESAGRAPQLHHKHPPSLCGAARRGRSGDTAQPVRSGQK